jgi:asparagine synthase (glutamine-hydrolysing)
MRDVLTHRGPDDAGQHLAPGVALGSRRLAILDLSERGHMPMSTPDGRCWIIYNGEVYNYRELRSTLEARGYAFRWNTDTECSFLCEGRLSQSHSHHVFQ